MTEPLERGEGGSISKSYFREFYYFSAIVKKTEGLHGILVSSAFSGHVIVVSIATHLCILSVCTEPQVHCSLTADY